MCRKKFIAVLVVLGISVCGTASSTVVKFNFYQSGFDEGAVVTGMFEGEDMDGDGFLVAQDKAFGPPFEVTDFNMKFSGNSIVPAFTFDFSDFSNAISPSLVYDLNDGPFLGGSSLEAFAVIQNTDASGVAVDDFGILLLSDGRTVVFSSEGSGTFSSELIKVSAVPLPAAVWLFGSGLLGLIGMRQIKSFY